MVAQPDIGALLNGGDDESVAQIDLERGERKIESDPAEEQIEEGDEGQSEDAEGRFFLKKKLCALGLADVSRDRGSTCYECVKNKFAFYISSASPSTRPPTPTAPPATTLTTSSTSSPSRSFPTARPWPLFL